MPKCSGPTCWTRGWSTPRGLPTDVGTRRREGRLRERVVAMRRASKKPDRAHPIFAAGASEEEVFKTKPTYQGTVPLSAKGPSPLSHRSSGKFDRKALVESV